MQVVKEFLRKAASQEAFPKKAPAGGIRAATEYMVSWAHSS